MDNSTRASQNPHSKSPPSINTSKLPGGVDARCEATKAIDEVKTESWKDLLRDTWSSSDGPNMCRVIQGLNGTRDANSPNEAMSLNGQTITDIKSKANIFIRGSVHTQTAMTNVKLTLILKTHPPSLLTSLVASSMI